MDIVEDLLRVLPPNTIRYPYKGQEDFWSRVATEQHRFLSDKTGSTSPYMLFTDVDNEAFARDFDPAQHKESWNCLDSYYPFTKLLLVRTIITRCQEIVNNHLLDLMLTRLYPMNSADISLTFYGRSETETPSRVKKPDKSFLPEKLPSSRSDRWPSFVMEAGLSTASAKLQADAKWWIAESEGDVRTVLVTTVNPKKPEIVIQKWDPLSIKQNNSEFKATPTFQHQVLLSRPEGPSEIAVENGPLVLPFEDIFLRHPVNDEGDMVLTDDDLKNLANMVWKYQQF